MGQWRSICSSSGRTRTTSRSASAAPSRGTPRSDLRVGLCDLTAGEMGSNGTPEERVAEGEAARAVLGAAWRENLRWPDRRIGKDPAHLDAGGRVHPAASAAGHRACRTGRIGIPITWRPASC